MTPEPVSTEVTLDYLSVRARIVVNRHGNRWRATFQRRWKEGGKFGEPETLQVLALDDATMFPDRFVALIGAVTTVIEEEDERIVGDDAHVRAG